MILDADEIETRLLGSDDPLDQLVGLGGIRHGEDPELDGHAVADPTGRVAAPRLESAAEGHWPNWLRHRSPKPAIPGSSPGCPACSAPRPPPSRPNGNPRPPYTPTRTQLPGRLTLGGFTRTAPADPATAPRSIALHGKRND